MFSDEDNYCDVSACHLVYCVDFFARILFMLHYLCEAACILVF